MICSFNRIDEFNVFFDLITNSCETIELSDLIDEIIIEAYNKTIKRFIMIFKMMEV